MAVDPAGSVYVTGGSRGRPDVPGRARPAPRRHHQVQPRRRAPLAREQSGSAGRPAAPPSWSARTRRASSSPGGATSRQSAGPSNVFFVKYDASSGKVAWMRTIGAGADANAGPAAAGMDASGAPIAAGSNNPSGEIVGYLAGVSVERRRRLAELVRERVHQSQPGGVRRRRREPGRRGPGRGLHAVGPVGRGIRRSDADRVPRPLQPGLADHGAARLRRPWGRHQPGQVHGGRHRAKTAATRSVRRPARAATWTPCS